MTGVGHLPKRYLRHKPLPNAHRSMAKKSGAGDADGIRDPIAKLGVPVGDTALNDLDRPPGRARQGGGSGRHALRGAVGGCLRRLRLGGGEQPPFLVPRLLRPPPLPGLDLAPIPQAA